MKTFKQFLENTNEEKKARHKQLVAEINALMEKTQGNLSKKEAEEFVKKTKEMDEIIYYFTKPLTPDKVVPQKDNILTPDIIATAQNELIADKRIYHAIVSAAAGVWFDKLTDIDKIIGGLNPDISKEDLHNAFAKSRQKKKNHYGDTIKLYRAQTKQMKKPTTNWATTEEYARQFGNKIVSAEIPVDKIIAVNVGTRGKYHELVVES
jgi:hypothetical protein